jgi:hypothetical protein
MFVPIFDRAKFDEWHPSRSLISFDYRSVNIPYRTAKKMLLDSGQLSTDPIHDHRRAVPEDDVIFMDMTGEKLSEKVHIFMNMGIHRHSIRISGAGVIPYTFERLQRKEINPPREDSRVITKPTAARKATKKRKGLTVMLNKKSSNKKILK